MKSLIDEDTKQLREEYLKQREKYDSQLMQQSNLLDKYLLTISTGSFGLSFAFIDKIVKDTMKAPTTLVLSWIMFALSVISSLLSFVFSKRAFKKAIEELDEKYEHPEYKFDTSFQDLQTKTFNVFSFIFLILGFSAFIFFAYNNIIGE